MARTIPQRELRNNNAEIVEAVTRGESFVITRHGEPVAELVPYRARRRQAVPKEEVIAEMSAGPSIDYKEFRRDLDHAIDQSLPDPWH